MSSSQPYSIRLAGASARARTSFDLKSQVGKPYDLDWRTAPTPAETSERLWKVLNRLDDEGKIDVVMSSGVAGRQNAMPKTGDTVATRVNRGAQLELFDADGNTVQEEDARSDTSRGWVYRLRTSVKRFGGRDTDYLCKLTRVAKKAALLIEKFDPELRRGAGYDMDNDAFDKNQALNIFADLALTIGVHPAALGISSASTGEYFLPKGYYLQVTICTNVFEYNRGRHLQQNSGLRTAKRFESCSIDPMIHCLKLQHDKTFSEVHRIRAVVVIEHRNLRETMGNLVRRETADWRGLLFVLTGGFPSLSTREFLHMLAKDPELDGVPFLFMSDHDPHAFEIYSTCKYGSRKNAFVTKSTICPKLQWAGATIEFYERMARSWPAIETERRIRENVIPESDRERVQKELQIEVTSKMLSRLTRGRGVLNKADTMRIKHFFNYEVFSDQHDPLLYADLQAMGMNVLGSEEAISSTAAGKKFPLAALCDPNVYGIQDCLLHILKEWGVSKAINSQHQLPDIEPGRAGFLAVQQSEWQPQAGQSREETSSQIRDQEEANRSSVVIDASDLLFGAV